VQGLNDARGMGLVDRLPRVHAVQTHGAYPLERAYARVAGLADATRMRYARTHRSQFMWPWEREPRSIAHGILDDETYDWAAVVEGMLDTRGHPIVVGEDDLRTANALARESTASDVDYTGTAGLAGFIHALATTPSMRHETIALIFSGARRPE
jgi:threonine synthase